MMREDSHDRYCKKCGADWLGEPIPKDDLHCFNSPKNFRGDNWRDYDFVKECDQFEKDIMDGKYDDDPEIDTHFSRRIGIYSMERDRTTFYKCPDCSDIVGRKEE